MAMRMGEQLQQQLQSLMGPGPERVAILAVLGAIVLVLLSIYVRGPIGTFFRVVVFFCAMAVIIGGTAILMNNVSLAGPPNPAVRLNRFLTKDWAATSDRGDGNAACADPSQLAARFPVDVEQHGSRHVGRRGRHNALQSVAAGAPAPAAPPAANPADEFPELVRIAYPGIPPERLMQVAASTIGGLPGWQVVSSDPKTMTINAVYHTRLLGFVDDVRVIITPRSEVDVCSRSRVGEPGSGSPLASFHGDFGANIGHIKELYLALAPAADEAYRQIELQETAQQHLSRRRSR
jgi:uncharacterized protein (DUF1499 family)